ncbi:RGS1-HXK1-interacting protein 1 isoform X2 [Cicer arietinum]|uniref:RGS1-HXK1-interacting protein 1 n=1 Tax=Cicer arietinum TaxID=3827 RepID=A0A1S2Z371_CICAR|nr:RGS1-HXK1-interacting protein 1 [Cicer arietinum]
MATVEESSQPEKTPAPVNHSTPTTTQPQTLDVKPFIDYAVGQALFYQKAFNDAIESSIEASTSRFSQIRSTSSAHFHQTLHYLDDFKSQYDAYEDLLFGKIKEGVLVAASHPVITCGATASVGLLVFKRPRRMLYYNTKRLFVSEESLVSRASAEVKELRQSIDILKSEVEKMEKSALHAEEQFLHGRTKLRQAGKQIRNVISSACKIERRAGGLKDILGELPKREASHFRSQVSKLASEAKREKNSLNKEVSKISNYGISV